jgi:hypothetical protein
MTAGLNGWRMQPMRSVCARVRGFSAQDETLQRSRAAVAKALERK